MPSHFNWPLLQGSVLGPFLFLSYVHDIWRTQSTIRLFADDCVIYRKIMNNDIEKLQIHLVRLGKWAVENRMKINPSKRQLASQQPG